MKRSASARGLWGGDARLLPTALLERRETLAGSWRGVCESRTCADCAAVRESGASAAEKATPCGMAYCCAYRSWLAEPGRHAEPTCLLCDVSTLCAVVPPPGLYGVVGTGLLWDVSTLCAVALLLD